MIISVREKFAFIHIPKNAGTNVRSQIMKYDKYNGKFNKIIDHAELGMTHTGHLTLDEIRENYPIQFQEILDCECFTVMRDPHDRFISALSQRLREFKNLLPVEVTQDKLLREANEVIPLIINKSSNSLPLELIHFRKQVDFIFDKTGAQVVKNIFDFKDIDKIFIWLQEDINLEIDYQEKQITQNSTMEINNSLLRTLVMPFIFLLKPILMRLPNSKKHNLKRKLIDWGLYSKSKNKSSIFYINNPEIKYLIDQHYIDDIKLYRNLSNL